MIRLSRARFGVLAVAGLLGFSAISGAVAPVAEAATTATTTSTLLPSTVTQDALPTVQINGVAWTQLVVGNTVYVGGSFTSARPAGSALGVNETPRSDLLAYNLTTGTLITTFAPTLNGQVKALSISPDGTRLYIGGAFTTVNGVTQNRIAAIDPSTGALISAFAVSASSTVNAIASTATSVYFGGNFSSVNSKTRTRLAQVTTAGVLTTWAPTATDNGVQAILMSPDGTKVVVGGQFDALNGVTDYGIGALDPTTGATLPFAAGSVTIDGVTSSSGIDSLTTDGTNIFAAGWGYSSGDFEGTMSVNPSTGAVNWLTDCFGDTYSVATLGGVMYTSGHTHDCAAAGYFPDNGVKHYGLAYSTTASTHTNAVDGRGWNYSAYYASNMEQWNPTFKIGTYTGQSQATWNVTTATGYVLEGGEFLSVNGVAQQGLVRFTTHANAKNAYKPSGIGTPTVAQSTVNGTPTVTIAASGAVDPDDTYLTYSLIRDGNTASPIATSTVQTPGFWVSPAPNVSFTDTTAALGSTHTYQIRAVDGGNGTTTSASVSVTAGGVSATDLALNKVASESSVYNGAQASLAVDGNTDGVFADGSVTHTNTDTNSWWQVDLGVTTTLAQIQIWNRTDCCSTRLSDYWVFVSSTPFDTTLTPAQQATQTGVWSTHLTTAPNPSTPIALPANQQGRYVMVQENTASTNLSLAEVQVNPAVGAVLPAVDVAVNKTATQSSDAYSGWASKAVDGNTDGVYNDLSVSHTGTDPNSWWQVDLGSPTTVSSIVVWNRTDCCSDRLTDFYVFTSATPFNTALTPAQQATQTGVWSTHLTSSPSPSTTITLPTGTQARYVMVQENVANQNLSLAEVQVYTPPTVIQ